MKKIKEVKIGTYDIGFGKPPVEHRFKQGQSGNPKGRPKGSKSWATLIQKELGRTVTVTQRGVEYRYSARQLIAKKLVSLAISGEPRHIDALARYDAAYEVRRAAIDAAHEEEREHERRRNERMRELTLEEVQVIERSMRILDPSLPFIDFSVIDDE